MQAERLRALPLIIGFAIEAIFISVTVVGRGASDTFFLKWYMGAALVAGALWLLVLRIWQPGLAPIKVILIFGVLFRVTLLAVPPTTSGDAFRYVWDGKILTLGINPYRHAPAAPELAQYRDAEVFPNINHPKLPTIYPPMAQIWFAVAYGIGGNSLWGLKFLNLLAELFTLWALWVLLKRTRLADPSWIVAFAWCPLPIMEFMTAAHMDALGLPWLVLFYLAATRRRPVAGALALAAATLVKLFPVVLLPLLLVRVGWRRWPLALFVFTVPVVAGYGLFMLGDVDPFVSARAYSWNWRFNAPLFSWLEIKLGDGFLARKVCLALFLALGLGVLFFRRDCVKMAQRILLAFYLCATTVFPWYLTWLAPGCVAVRSFPVLWLIVTAPLTYVTELGYRVNGDWSESRLVWAVEFIPIALWLVGSGIRGVSGWRSGRYNPESSARPARSP